MENISGMLRFGWQELSACDVGAQFVGARSSEEKTNGVCENPGTRNQYQE